MVQVACRDTPVMMVQPSLHSHVTLVDGIEMPTPATGLTAVGMNHFLMKVQVPAGHPVTGVAIGDTHAILG